MRKINLSTDFPIQGQVHRYSRLPKLAERDSRQPLIEARTLSYERGRLEFLLLAAPSISGRTRYGLIKSFA